MGSNLNFKNIGFAPPAEAGGSKPLEDSSLVRQPSIYSLTFDEFQNTWGGGPQKDFGSMNMDELLKNIWTAEETQALTNSTFAGEGNAVGTSLQRQGSLTLPRTLSHKTVDEVWRDLIKESSGDVKDGSYYGAVSNMPQRQPTLGEITLEKFLARAGVVREDAQQVGRPNNGGFFGDLTRLNNNIGNATALALGFQQPNQNSALMGTPPAMQNSHSFVASQPPSLAPNVGGIRPSHQVPQQQLLSQPPPPQQQQQLQPQPQLFPKTTNVSFASAVNLVNSAQITSPGVRGSVVGTANTSTNNDMGLTSGLRTGDVTVAAASPAHQTASDTLVKNNTDSSSLSPVPYVFTRGRKAGASFEKVVERRQRRMIKNRESAARSRARKQAYQLELEAEIAKLKEVNEELQKKQSEVLEKWKKQTLETVSRQWGGKRQCLRRTLTGPW